MLFHNRSNYDYHFVTKELVKEFEGEFNCLGERCKTFSVPITKEDIPYLYAISLYQKPYLSNYHLLTAQDLWQADYQPLLTTLLVKLIKLNATMDIIIKNAKRVESNTKIVSAVLNTKALKMI